MKTVKELTKRIDKLEEYALKIQEDSDLTHAETCSLLSTLESMKEMYDWSIQTIQENELHDRNLGQK